jgi:hypothetical protein
MYGRRRIVRPKNTTRASRAMPLLRAGSMDTDLPLMLQSSCSGGQVV